MGVCIEEKKSVSFSFSVRLLTFTAPPPSHPFTLVCWFGSFVLLFETVYFLFSFETCLFCCFQRLRFSKDGHFKSNFSPESSMMYITPFFMTHGLFFVG